MIGTIKQWLAKRREARDKVLDADGYGWALKRIAEGHAQHVDEFLRFAHDWTSFNAYAAGAERALKDHPGGEWATTVEEFTTLNEREGFLIDGVFQWFEKLGLMDDNFPLQVDFAEQVVRWVRQNPEKRTAALNKLGAALEAYAPAKRALFRDFVTGDMCRYVDTCQREIDNALMVVYYNETKKRMFVIPHAEMYGPRFELVKEDEPPKEIPDLPIG